MLRLTFTDKCSPSTAAGSRVSRAFVKSLRAETALRIPTCGNIVADMVNVTDRMEAVEALRASEQLLRRLTEALPLGIVQIDVEQRVVYQNERIGEIVGVTGATTIAQQFAYVAAAD